MPGISQLNSGTIRRLILTLVTGYLTVFGVRQIPYEFENEWLVLVPALILVYALTIWVVSKIFKEESVPASVSKPIKKKAELSTKGFKQLDVVPLSPKWFIQAMALLAVAGMTIPLVAGVAGFIKDELRRPSNVESIVEDRF